MAISPQCIGAIMGQSRPLTGMLPWLQGAVNPEKCNPICMPPWAHLAFSSAETGEVSYAWPATFTCLAALTWGTLPVHLTVWLWKVIALAHRWDSASSVIWPDFIHTSSVQTFLKCSDPDWLSKWSFMCPFLLLLSVSPVPLGHFIAYSLFPQEADQNNNDSAFTYW